MKLKVKRLDLLSFYFLENGNISCFNQRLDNCKCYFAVLLNRPPWRDFTSAGSFV